MKLYNLRNHGRLTLIALSLNFALPGDVAKATPRLGSECINCHETATGPAPAPVTPDEPTTLPPIPSAPAVPEIVQDAPPDDLPQAAPTPQPQAPKPQIAQPARTPPTQPAQVTAAQVPQQTPELRQDQAVQNVRRDPLTFGLNLGFLASSNIEQHRSNSILHGDARASFSQPGAEGSGHGEDMDPVSGNRLHFGVRGDYQVELGDQAALIFGARVFHDEFIDEDFSRLNARLSVGMRKRFDDQMLRLTAYLQQTTFDGEIEDLKTDFDTLGVRVDYSRELANGATLLGALHARQRDYEGETDPRESEFSSSFSVLQIGSDLSSQEFGVAFLSRNNPRREQNRYDSPSVFASMTRPITPTTTLGLFGELGIRTYKAEDPTAGETRSDRFGEVGFSLQDSRLKVLSASPRFSCAYSRTISNIDLFDSDGSYCALMLETRF